MHLAAAIAIVLPLAVVVHGLVGATSQFAIAPRLVEFATAAATLVGVTLVFWIELQPSDPMPTALRALTIVATAGVLLLAGLYVVDYGRRFGAVADREAD